MATRVEHTPSVSLSYPSKIFKPTLNWLQKFSLLEEEKDRLSLVLGLGYHPVVLFCEILTLWLPIRFPVGVILGVKILSELRGTVDVNTLNKTED